MYMAICDDHPQELTRIAQMVTQYAQSSGASIHFQVFTDAEAMLRAAKSERFTHYLLDVMMPCMDGISAAQEIRQFDEDAKIVFLTSFTEYAYQSYRVKAHDYLLKPVQEAQFFDLLRQFQTLEESTEACICIQNGRSIFRIPFARLSYLEVYQKKLSFHITDGGIREISGSLSEYEKELLARDEFIKIHRSYIINLKQVSALSPEGCVMFSGIILPISRLLYHQVREKYMAHLFGNVEA